MSMCYYCPELNDVFVIVDVATHRYNWEGQERVFMVYSYRKIGRRWFIMV